MSNIAAPKENVKRRSPATSSAEIIQFPKSVDIRNDVFISTARGATKAIFATWALDLRSKGLAVLPITQDRTPLVSRHNKWSYAPSQAFVVRCSVRFPDAQIAIIPGLSAGGVLVIDCDTLEAAAEFQARFGPSNFRVRTSRGLHLYYRRVPFRLPGNLKKLGLNIDCKFGNQLVIAPHSIHKNGQHVYALDDGCEWATLTDGTLSRLDHEKLRDFIRQGSAVANAKMERRAAAKAETICEPRDDSRRLCINDTVLGESIRGATRDEAISMAFRINEGFAKSDKGRLPDDEVVKYALQAWEDAQSGKFVPWGNGRRSVVRTTADEIDVLSPDALYLLAKLRAEHAAKIERDETFAIAATAMAKAKIMSRHRIERAREELSKKGLIVRAAYAQLTPSGRLAAQFKFAR